MKRTITALVLGVALLLASGGGGYAQDFGKGLEAAQKGDLATALREWSALAEQGHVGAQYNLGVIVRRYSCVDSNLVHLFVSQFITPLPMILI